MSARPTPALKGGNGVTAVPRHVAIIMDGNGRWAKKRHLPRMAGHRKGIEAAKNVVRAAGDLGIEVLTLYAFSTENWSRPADEVRDLMGLLRHFIQKDIAELAANGVRLKLIGDFSVLAPDLVEMIEEAIDKTAGNSRTVLAIALNYGSRREITNAVRRLTERAKADDLDPATIDEAMIEAELDTADLPPPDLLIRTSGEQRLSNFLLWQLAYAELVFTETLWPDFGKDELAAAIAVFGLRHRRYGGL